MAMIPLSKGKFVDEIDFPLVNRHLGCYPTKAARVYDNAAKKFYGEFAYLNFPKGG